jgi:hypothetical protein
MKIFKNNQDNLKNLSSLKETIVMKPDSESTDFPSLNQWGEYLNFCLINDNAKDSQILQNVEILLKKIEVVNIAQGNLSNYIDNLDYAINLYENKRSSLIGR